MLKFCNTCQQEKNISEFYVAKTSKDGYSSQCKECIKARQARYNASHREEQKKRDAQYRKENYDKIRAREKSPERQAYLKKYREEHKEYDSNWHKEYYQQNKEAILARQKKYYQHPQNKDKKRQYYYNNVEKFKQYQKEYRLKNAEQIKEKDRQRHKINRLSRVLSYQIWHSLKDVKAERHWESLTAFTLQELKEDLESKFQPGMTWDNQGKEGWHIDHIIPQDVFFPFESENDEKFKICWSLYNLRPLWYKENLNRPRDEGSDISDKVKIDIISKALNIDTNSAKEKWYNILHDYYKRVGVSFE